MDAVFQNITGFLLFWIIPLLIPVFLLSGRARKKALIIFSGNKGESINSRTANRRRINFFLIVAALCSIFIAFTRPAWNRVEKVIRKEGRDVVFLIDVSASMSADDLKPNRLEHAKLAVKDSLSAMDGDRVALVAFAGNAVIKCPLTMDYSFFRYAVDSLDNNSVSRGGTLIGDALRKVLYEVFDDQEKGYKDIILITDGEDHESFPVEAAELLGSGGIRLIAVGLGNDETGKRIPVTDKNGEREFLTHQGQEVWSKLDAETLRKMAASTPEGRYLNVATGTFDLGSIYKSLISSGIQRKEQGQKIVEYEEKFQIFLITAFLLLLFEALGSIRRKG